MRIERIVVQIEIGISVGGTLPRIGDGEIVCADGFGFLVLAAFGIGNRDGPVIAVIAQRADELLFRHDFQHALQIGDEPALRRDRTGIGIILRARRNSSTPRHQHCWRYG